MFSHGFICPKGSTLKQLHEDPNRLRTPLVRRDGKLVAASWDEAFAEIDRRLAPIIEHHGRDAVAVYLGNPNAHSLAGMLYGKALVKAIGSRNVYTASTVDQRPKELSAALMFGGGLIVPVPDVDRTDFLLMLGANPYASNGSLATAPDWPGRIEALRARGGKLVVVDPRRSRTAEEADEWIAVRPGSDPFLLAAMVRVLLDEGLVDLGDVAAVRRGSGAARRRRWRRSGPTRSPTSPASTRRRSAGSPGSWSPHRGPPSTDGSARRPPSSARSPAGSSTCSTSAPATSIAQAGRCSPRRRSPGRNTHGAPRVGRGVRPNHPRSRGTRPARHVRRVARRVPRRGDRDAGTGADQGVGVRRRQPGAVAAQRWTPRRRPGSLELMVSVDIYRNETSRHADVILPAPSALEKPHYDVALLQLAVRNVANWSEPVLPLPDGQPDEWEVLARLALIAQGAGAVADPAIVDDLVIGALIGAAVADEHGPLHGRSAEELLAALAPRTGPARIIDFYLRSGPYGDHFGANPDGLTLDALIAAPHGIDLGPLQPRMPDGLRTPTGMIDVAPQPILDDLPRMEAALRRPATTAFVLVGRRDLRSNNSWMHNVEVLVKGKPRCVLHVHPDDASAIGLADGGQAKVTSRVGTVVVPVEVTDGIRQESSACPTAGATTYRASTSTSPPATPASTPTCSPTTTPSTPSPAPPSSTASRRTRAGLIAVPGDRNSPSVCSHRRSSG